MTSEQITFWGLKVGYLIFLAAISFRAYQIFKTKQLKDQEDKNKKDQQDNQ